MLHHALSLKQPWAALLAHGVKSVEVRRWRTDYGGRLLIHAARVPDERPEAWALVPDRLRGAAELGGGIVGVGRLTSCKSYRSRSDFAADQALHLNDPAWFEPRGLYGLCFADLHPLPFRRVPGFFRIFEVDLDLELPTAPESPGGLSEVLRRFRRLAQSLSGKSAPDK
jgi:hypothetical protein